MDLLSSSSEGKALTANAEAPTLMASVLWRKAKEGDEGLVQSQIPGVYSGAHQTAEALPVFALLTRATAAVRAFFDALRDRLNGKCSRSRFSETREFFYLVSAWFPRVRPARKETYLFTSTFGIPLSFRCQKERILRNDL